ncbi:MAG TPA: serine hydrolase [Bryobacteraceae bacterium]|nr:serine hydrolase [Bryobacteraceae bacterium]
MLRCFLAALTMWIVLCSVPLAAQDNSEAGIRAVLADRIDAQKQGVGIVVGVIGPQGRRIVSYGSFDPGDPRPLNGDTVFEIGSMTKVFTSLAMMDMAQHGEIALTDPIAKYLPPEVKVPERNGRKITFEDLSTQSSGLPRLPSNMHPANLLNPYADYTVAQLYEFLAGYQLKRDIGEKYEYSNLGVGLLGHVLSLRAKSSYEVLVKTRILAPLGMSSTGITLTPEMQARFTPGHNAGLKVTPHWDLPTLAGAGALRSTANDMLTFLAANLGYKESPLAPAMAAMVKVRKPTGTEGMLIAYGWHIFERPSGTIIWHNGGTGGFQTFMGYDPKAKTGVVVLSNTSARVQIDDIGRHLLNPDFPLTTQQTEVPEDRKTLDTYVGRYELGPNFVLTITREDNHLYGQATGQGRFELFAEGPGQFFAKVGGIKVNFATDSLTLHQNGNRTVAKRLPAQ